MTLQELYDELIKHDWYYEHSDDFSVWNKGRNNAARLQALAKQIEGGIDLLKEFAGYKYSWPGKGIEQKPKPVRPS